MTALRLLAATAACLLAAPALAAGDQDFVKAAAQAGMAEVQASKLALRKSQDEGIRKFAQRMVDDHGKAGGKLKAIAQSENLPLPRQPSEKQHKKLEGLGKVSGAKFNQRYLEFFGVPAHEEAVNLFEREAKSGEHADLRRFAQDALPTLREHLQMARGLQG